MNKTTKNKEQHFYIAKTLRMMNYLVRQGFDCIKVKTDRNNPKFKIFIFEDSEELRNCLKHYK